MKHLPLLLALLALFSFTSCSDLFGDDEEKTEIVVKTLTISSPGKNSTTLINMNQQILPVFNPAPTSVSCYRNGTLLSSTETSPYTLNFATSSVAGIDTIVVKATWSDGQTVQDTLFYTLIGKEISITSPTVTDKFVSGSTISVTANTVGSPSKVTCTNSEGQSQELLTPPYIFSIPTTETKDFDTIVTTAYWEAATSFPEVHDTLVIQRLSDTLSLVGGETIEYQKRPWIIASAQIDGNVHIKSGAVLHIPSTAMRIKNGTLTIDSGAVLKFAEETYIEVYTQGNIVANGTATAPVTFTNLNAGTYWGYSYTGTSGGGIYIEEDAATNNSLTGVVINMANVGIQAQREKGLTVTASTISNSEYYGMVIQNNSLTSLATSTFIANGTNDMFVKSGVLPYIAAGNSLSKAIEVEHSATDLSGTIPAYTYLFNGSYFIKGDGTGTPKPVTIAEGALCTFKEGAYLEVNTGGQLIVAGTVNSPVTFTNAEAGKYWGYPYTGTSGGGICIEENAATGNSISNAIINRANVGLQSQREKGISINATRFTASEYYGVVAQSKTLSSMENCFFSGSGVNDIYAKSGVITQIGTGNTFEKAIQIEGSTTEFSGTIQPYTYQVDGSFFIHGISTTPTPVTILPGATLKFKEGAYLEVDKGGQLIAKGTAASPITFDNAEPGKFWGYPYTGVSGGGIFIEDDAAIGQEFDHIVIDSANVGINNDVPNSFSLTNSTISGYEYYGIVSMPNTNDITTTNTINSSVATAVTAVHFDD